VGGAAVGCAAGAQAMIAINAARTARTTNERVNLCIFSSS
jgi:hypothetical protein